MNPLPILPYKPVTVREIVAIRAALPAAVAFLRARDERSTRYTRKPAQLAA